MPKNSCIMQIWAESGKSALPICNYSQILYQFLTFTQNLKRSRKTLWIQLGSDLLKKYMIFFRFYLTKAEFLALTPKDFDFEKNTLDITKSLQRVKKQDVVTPPKTSRSIRNIIIPDFVMNEVKAL